MRAARTGVAVLVLLALVATGCGDDGEPDADPTSPSGTSEEPTGSPNGSPTVEPADGKAIQGDNFSLNVPRGWSVQRRSLPLSVLYVADRQEPGNALADFINVSYAETASDRPLEARAKEAIRNSSFATAPTLQPETELDGEEAYHVEGEVGAGIYYIGFGAVHDGQLVEISFESYLMNGQETEEVADAVLASFRWQ